MVSHRPIQGADRRCHLWCEQATCIDYLLLIHIMKAVWRPLYTSVRIRVGLLWYCKCYRSMVTCHNEKGTIEKLQQELFSMFFFLINTASHLGKSPLLSINSVDSHHQLVRFIYPMTSKSSPILLFRRSFFWNNVQWKCIAVILFSYLLRQRYIK